MIDEIQNLAYPQMKLPIAKKDVRNDKRADVREKRAASILEETICRRIQ